MRYFSSPKKRSAYLLFELAISLLVLMVLMQFLFPLLANARHQSSDKIRLLDRLELKAAVMDHFQSQLAPLFFKACGNGNSDYIEIGRAIDNLPERISHKALLEGSDWLNASQNAQCNYPLTMTSLTPTLAYSCDWDVGDIVVFSSCNISAKGLITQVKSASTDFSFSNAALLGASGIVLSQQGFIWYLADGKSDDAFWRTPSLSGNSLELWSGITKLSIYPLLDLDDNGALDTLVSEYGVYQVSQLKGLWLELLVKQMPCRHQDTVSMEEYLNHRGDIWLYNARCEFPVSFVVN
ncbi:hypothetical protein A9Q77_12215 [Marinomonas sp. 42_23_T18]|nr:hypothetical protein A9Q77_12215 [Marinomonas sp. 42_23_T18]